MDSMQTKFTAEYSATEFANYTVHGQPAGLVKNAGTLSYLRVFGAYVVSLFSTGIGVDHIDARIVDIWFLRTRSGA